MIQMKMKSCLPTVELTGQSIDAESQTQNVTSSSQRRKNIKDHGKAQKKSKGERSQAPFTSFLQNSHYLKDLKLKSHQLQKMK
jgi:hypothetical protein